MGQISYIPKTISKFKSDVFFISIRKFSGFIA